MKLPSYALGKPSDDAEEVDGILCWDPEIGPIGPGPHAPAQPTYRTYIGRDGHLKFEPIRRTDDGEERLVWDDEQMRYVKIDPDAFEQAMRGEQATRRPRPASDKIFVADEIGDIFDEVTKEKLKDIMKKYGL